MQNQLHRDVRTELKSMFEIMCRERNTYADLGVHPGL